MKLSGFLISWFLLSSATLVAADAGNETLAKPVEQFDVYAYILDNAKAHAGKYAFDYSAPTSPHHTFQITSLFSVKLDSEMFPFLVKDDIVYCVKYDRLGPGATIEADQLTDGKSLWMKTVNVFNVTFTSEYTNRVSMKFDSDGHLEIMGHEPGGRYTLTMDMVDGNILKTVTKSE